MGDYDRRVYDPSWKDLITVEADVLGSTEVEKGDLLFLDKVDGLRDRGTSTASWTLFPLSAVSSVTNTLEANRTLAKTYFYGVAAWHSDSGVTEKLAVHCSGLFRYPLKNSRKVRPFYRVQPAGSGTTLYAQKVQVATSGSDYIGAAAEYADFASDVEFVLSTEFARYIYL